MRGASVRLRRAGRPASRASPAVARHRAPSPAALHFRVFNWYVGCSPAALRFHVFDWYVRCSPAALRSHVFDWYVWCGRPWAPGCAARRARIVDHLVVDATDVFHVTNANFDVGAPGCAAHVFHVASAADVYVRGLAVDVANVNVANVHVRGLIDKGGPLPACEA